LPTPANQIFRRTSGPDPRFPGCWRGFFDLPVMDIPRPSQGPLTGSTKKTIMVVGTVKGIAVSLFQMAADDFFTYRKAIAKLFP